MTRRTIGPEFFGIHINSGYAGATDVGVGYLRIWDVGCTWRQTETAKGVFSWTAMDAAVAQADALGVKCLLTLGQPPAWATGDVLGTGHEGAAYNDLPPTSLTDWTDYLTAVLTRYPGKIKALEVWNEPSFDYYSGTIAQLVDMAEATYTTAHGIDATIKVFGPSCATGSSLSRTYLDDFLTAGGKNWIDGLSHHYYIYPQQPEYQFEPYIGLFIQSMLTKHGITGLPVWNTEWTYDTWSDESAVEQSGAMSEDMAASYLVRHAICSWITRTDANFFYGLTFPSFNTIEAVDPNTPTTINKAGRARAYTAELLTGGQLYNCRRDAGDLYSARFVTAGVQRGRVFWHKDWLSSQPDLSAFRGACDVEGNAVSLSGLTVTSVPVWCFE